MTEEQRRESDNTVRRRRRRRRRGTFLHPAAEAKLVQRFFFTAVLLRFKNVFFFKYT